ncbi:hypothetical protein NUSPORA_02671 [Nucleospora cyclopteri]
MWENNKAEKTSYEEYLLECTPEKDETIMFPTIDEFGDIIRYLPNWKAAGVDGVNNFFIKRIKSLHQPLYEIIKGIIVEAHEQLSWFYQGLTYLMTKGTPSKGSDFRPITCMSNLYKLTTKCVTQVMQLGVKKRKLLAENQLGTVRKVQGAKEQALLNLALNKEHGNQLKTAWIDVKKAYDSIDHDYLLQCINKLNFPKWITRFLESIVSKWIIDIRVNKKSLLKKRVARGILQGDSLSPLLFVLCMDPMSRKLNGKYPKVTAHSEDGTYACNHLLFIDDLKLLACDDSDLKGLLDETKRFFEVVGLEINKDKCTTNSPVCENDATLMDGTQGYKYLGIIENSKSEDTGETAEKIKVELLARVERLCKTKLNSKNLFRAINEHAISLVNYYIGVLKIEPDDFARLNEEIRLILTKNKIHFQPNCKERLYLPRTEMGRGLFSIEQTSKQMLLQLKTQFEKD